MIELEWDPKDSTSSLPYQTAQGSSPVTNDGLMMIEYKGWSTNDAKPFAGVVRIPLSTVTQSATGSGTLGKANAPFSLIGAFADEECTRYEGTWTEAPGEVWTFSFDITVSPR